MDAVKVDQVIADMANWYLDRKPKFIDKAREEFEAVCYFAPDEDDYETQTVMNQVFTDWILFDSDVFGTTAIENYLRKNPGLPEVDREVLRQLDLNQRFGYFRYDGVAGGEEAEGGVRVYDPFIGLQFPVTCPYTQQRAIETKWEVGSGVSMRVAEVDGCFYRIGQLLLHDVAPFDHDANLTREVARLSRNYGVSPMLPLAMSVLNPFGLFNGSLCIYGNAA